ncbi:4-(cytidine 5'-diphospho)-2-C-methyl-D-erythritol kinase [Microbulbifer halophilus]|uniref:4-diphosphocytidyl-2-C-methyl-D-erythritol kinase n=1 Tax=Microbulbifer halophilus TaxID=453963 RepID=A0ABW5E6L2_9GAMM|nr:4-(cytidine 5'-diphospho)-2-C-methyl-D-erythritol kinase [Microbulbifer halophilus]MCW8125599.1 4-(cytidine 5'-diphospho)-2-C-methyl-D-erythritol kinase [Microbulbifer halophilus]
MLLSAPAKLNLILRILGRRADGYHELQTLFQLLDFGDELRLELRDDNEISVDSGSLEIPLEENLIYRAARLLQRESGCGRGAHIVLQKKLPHGGGIGGGSSDAATTLLGLNHLWQCDLSLSRLAQLGRTLGADVPVFVRGRTAWAEGVGEKLVPVETPPRHYLVVVPDCAVSTAAVFGHPGLTRDSAAITLAHLREGRLDGRWLEQHFGNDCQALVERLYPEIRAAREWLQQFAQAQLTGTGACVFAAFDSATAAKAALAELPERWRGFVAAGVDESPTHRQLAKIAAGA